MSHVLPKIAATVLPNRARSLLFPLIILSCLGTAVFGQAVVQVTGRVVDDSGKPVVGAAVRVTTLSEYMQPNTLTDEDGRFSILRKVPSKVPLYPFAGDSHFWKDATNWQGSCGLDINETARSFQVWLDKGCN